MNLNGIFGMLGENKEIMYDCNLSTLDIIDIN
jgi:hypothetical protein